MTTLTCPLCHHRVDPLLLSFAQKLEARVVAALAAANPGWKQAEGVCPACVAVLMSRLRVGPPQSVLYDPWGRAVPAYPVAQGRVLPVPVRVHASPTYLGRGVTIAMLDSGFYPHPDLLRPRRRILATIDVGGEKVIERADFSEPRVMSWHGTMTACVAAGSGVYSDGLYRGIAPEANLVLIKVTTPNGRIGEREIARGLAWVLANHRRYGIRLVNISVGGSQHRPAQSDRYGLVKLILQLRLQGVLVIAAVGNAGIARVGPPGSVPFTLTVGGLDDQNVLDARRHQMYSSNYGRGLRGVPKPEMIAPAIWLPAPILPETDQAREAELLMRLREIDDLPTLRRELRKARAVTKVGRTLALKRHPLEVWRAEIEQRLINQKFIHARYQHVDGTSFAAPIVAATAAQMLEAHPGLHPRLLKRLLMRAARPLPHVPPERQGCGPLDAGRAVAYALRAPGGRLEGVPLSPHITRREILFIVEDHGYERVEFVSDLTAWRPFPLERFKRGYWLIKTVVPPPGQYVYKFLVDDTWIEDYENGYTIEDGYGGLASVLVIPPT